jgi:hypothetical protein
MAVATNTLRNYSSNGDVRLIGKAADFIIILTGKYE